MSKMMKLLTVLPLVISCCAVAFFPTQVLLQYRLPTSDGAFGSKYELFLLPLVTLLAGFVLDFADKKVRRQGESAVLTLVSLLFLNGLNATAVYAAGTGVEGVYQLAVGKNHLLFVMIAGLFVLLGSLLPSLPVIQVNRNQSTWSLTRYTMLKESRRYGSYALIAVGISGLVLSALPVSNLAGWLLLSGVLVAANGAAAVCVLAVRRKLIRQQERS